MKGAYGVVHCKESWNSCALNEKVVGPTLYRLEQHTGSRSYSLVNSGCVGRIYTSGVV